MRWLSGAVIMVAHGSYALGTRRASDHAHASSFRGFCECRQDEETEEEDLSIEVSRSALDILSWTIAVLCYRDTFSTRKLILRETACLASFARVRQYACSVCCMCACVHVRL